MATIAQNLQSLINDRTAIITAISSKGGSVSNTDGFDDFATAIGTIPTGSTIEQGFFSGPVSTLYPIYSNITLNNSELFVDAVFTSEDIQQQNRPLVDVYIPLPSDTTAFTSSMFSNVNLLFTAVDYTNESYYTLSPFPTLGDNCAVSLDSSGANKYGKIRFTAKPSDESGKWFTYNLEYHLTLHATITL